MLFYDSANPAPNPRRVRIFLAEKGLRVPMAHVSIREGEHRSNRRPRRAQRPAAVEAPA